MKYSHLLKRNKNVSQKWQCPERVNNALNLKVLSFSKSNIYKVWTVHILQNKIFQYSGMTYVNRDEIYDHQQYYKCYVIIIIITPD